MRERREEWGQARVGVWGEGAGGAQLHGMETGMGRGKRSSEGKRATVAGAGKAMRRFGRDSRGGVGGAGLEREGSVRGQRSALRCASR